jgi:chromosome segregation ATPase
MLRDRIEAFQKNHVPSLIRYFEKSISHFTSVLDAISSHVASLRAKYDTALIDNQAELDRIYHEKQQELASSLTEAAEQHKARIADIEQKTKSVRTQSDQRISEESQRVVDHFEKQLTSKCEAHEMTIAAIERAQQELDLAVSERNADLSTLQEENNRALSEYAAKLADKTKDLDARVDAMQSQLDRLRSQQNDLGPELEKLWQAKQKEIDDEFRLETARVTQEIADKKDAIALLQKQISDEEAELSRNRENADLLKRKQLSELEQNLKAILDCRAMEIEEAKQRTVAKYNELIATLEESLRELQEKNNGERSELEAQISGKKAKRAARLNDRIRDKEQEIQQLQDEIAAIEGMIEGVKAGRDAQVAEIERSFERDLAVLAQKEALEGRYFEAKLTALQQELARVMAENQAITEPVFDQAALEDAEQGFLASEVELSHKFTIEMEAQIQAKVEEQLRELRERHRQERIALLQQANELERQTVEKAATEEEAQEPEVDQGWRGYIPATRSLKQEEANALQALQNGRTELRQAVDKTNLLRQQLLGASAKYEEELERVRSGGETELQNLRDIVGGKEKEILSLERQFEENEKEVRKRMKQIESAEQRLTDLRAQLSQEKAKIRDQIQKEYQPLLHQEAEKTEAVMSELEKLKAELGMSIELLKSDLYDVETSNAALDDSLKQETEKMVAQLKTELEQQYADEEMTLVSKLTGIEREEMNSIRKEKAVLDEEERKYHEEKLGKVEEEKKEFEQKLAELNNECAQVLSGNVDKRRHIQAFTTTECKTCPLLDKNIKKLEKLLVKMQIHDRDLLLDGQNKKDMIHKLHTKAKLPPLPARPM